MSGAIWLILGMGAGVFGLRLAGLILRDVALPPSLEQGLRFVPVALLSAIVVASLTGQVSADPTRLVAAVGAGLVAYRTGRTWACILAGMGLYWALQAW